MTPPESAAGSTETDAPAESYAAATAEIDTILGELERDDLDVDLLSAKVARAAELLAWCRGRIRIATDEVAGAVASLDGDDEPPTADEPF